MTTSNLVSDNTVSEHEFHKDDKDVWTNQLEG